MILLLGSSRDCSTWQYGGTAPHPGALAQTGPWSVPESLYFSFPCALVLWWHFTHMLCYRGNKHGRLPQSQSSHCFITQCELQKHFKWQPVCDSKRGLKRNEMCPWLLLIRGGVCGGWDSWGHLRTQAGGPVLRGSSIAPRCAAWHVKWTARVEKCHGQVRQHGSNSITDMRHSVVCDVLRICQVNCRMVQPTCLWWRCGHKPPHATWAQKQEQPGSKSQWQYRMSHLDSCPSLCCHLNVALNPFLRLDYLHCFPVLQGRVRRAPGLLPGEAQALVQPRASGYLVCTKPVTVKPSSAVPKHCRDKL